MRAKDVLCKSKLRKSRLSPCQGRITSTESAEDLEKKRKGFHCLSAWDGSHRGFEQLIKQRLNDPNNMETLETRIAPSSDGSHAIQVSFTAKNAFGGRVRNTALGLIDHDTCEATILLKLE